MLKDAVMRPSGIGPVFGRVADRVVAAGQRKRSWYMWSRWISLPSTADRVAELDPVLAVMWRGPR